MDVRSPFDAGNEFDQLIQAPSTDEPDTDEPDDSDEPEAEGDEPSTNTPRQPQRYQEWLRQQDCSRNHEYVVAPIMTLNECHQPDA